MIKINLEEKYSSNLYHLVKQINETKLNSLIIEADADNCYMIANGIPIAIFIPKKCNIVNAFIDITDNQENPWERKRYKESELERNPSLVNELWAGQIYSLINYHPHYAKNYFFTYATSYIKNGLITIKYNFIDISDKKEIFYMFFRDAFNYSARNLGGIKYTESIFDKNSFKIYMSNGRYNAQVHPSQRDSYIHNNGLDMMDKFKKFCQMLNIACSIKLSYEKSFSQNYIHYYDLFIELDDVIKNFDSEKSEIILKENLKNKHPKSVPRCVKDS